MTDASTFAGDDVFGSLSNEITLSKIVLKKKLHFTRAILTSLSSVRPVLILFYLMFSEKNFEKYGFIKF